MNPQSSIEALLALTREVQELAESGDWAGAAKLESQRRPLMDRILVDRSRDGQRHGIDAAIRTVVEMDAALVDRLKASRAQALKEAAKHLAFGTAARAYATASGHGGEKE